MVVLRPLLQKERLQLGLIVFSKSPRMNGSQVYLAGFNANWAGRTGSGHGNEVMPENRQESTV